MISFQWFDSKVELDLVINFIVKSFDFSIACQVQYYDPGHDYDQKSELPQRNTNTITILNIFITVSNIVCWGYNQKEDLDSKNEKHELGSSEKV